MKIKLTLLLCLIYNIAFSQVEEKEKNHILSVNVNYMLDQWLSPTDEESIFDIAPDHLILVMYRNRGFRIGAGGVFRKENLEDAFFAGNIWSQSHRAYVLQLGAQGIKNVWKKWDFIYGGDVLLQHRIFRSILTETNSTFLEPGEISSCLLYTSPSPRDATLSRMPSSA